MDGGGNNSTPRAAVFGLMLVLSVALAVACAIAFYIESTSWGLGIFVAGWIVTAIGMAFTGDGDTYDATGGCLSAFIFGFLAIFFLSVIWVVLETIPNRLF